MGIGRSSESASASKVVAQSPAVLVEQVSLRDAVTMPHCEGCAAETTPAPARGKHPAGDWATNNLHAWGLLGSIPRGRGKVKTGNSRLAPIWSNSPQPCWCSSGRRAPCWVGDVGGASPLANNHHAWGLPPVLRGVQQSPAVLVEQRVSAVASS